MGLSKCKLAELIELVTETNSELKYKADDVRGMTITKEIIPTKANVKDIDLSKFLVVHPHEFIFNPRTHGKKIGFGYNNSEDTFLISWNNIAFRVSSKAKGRVLAKYLFLHFNRSEWDREACFRSWEVLRKFFHGMLCVKWKLTFRPSTSSGNMWLSTMLCLPTSKAMSVGWRI